MPGLADDKSACLGLWLLDSRGALLEKREGSTEETFGKKALEASEEPVIGVLHRSLFQEVFLLVIFSFLDETTI